MKKLMITAALVVGLISLGYSQNTPERSRPERNKPERQMKTPEERAQLSTDALEKRLNLTAEQKTKVYALNLERSTKMEKMRNSEIAFRKGQMEKHKDFMNETDKKLNKILSNEQQKSYQEMKTNSKEKMKNHPKRMDGKSRVK